MLNQQQRIQEQGKTNTSEWKSSTNNEEKINQTTDNDKNSNWKEVTTNKKRKITPTISTNETQHNGCRTFR